MPCRTSSTGCVAAGASLGEQPLLQVGQPRAEQVERGLARRPCRREAGRGPGVDRAQVDRAGGQPQLVADPDVLGGARPWCPSLTSSAW